MSNYYWISLNDLQRMPPAQRVEFEAWVKDQGIKMSNYYWISLNDLQRMPPAQRVEFEAWVKDQGMTLAIDINGRPEPLSDRVGPFEEYFGEADDRRMDERGFNK